MDVIHDARRPAEKRIPNGGVQDAEECSAEWPLSTARLANQTLHAIEAEVSVLGAIMIGGREAIASVADELRPDHFVDDRHRRIYDAAYTINGRGQEPDATSILEQLRLQDQLDGVGGFRYLGELLDAVATASQIGQHAQLVIDRARRRTLVRSISRAQRSTCQGADLAGIIFAIQTDLEVLGRGDQRDDRPRLLTGDDLFAREASPPRWIVDSLIPLGRQGSVFGAPGVAKSMLMRILAGGIAMGSPHVLGRFAALKGPFLWVTAEEDEDELRRGFTITAAGSEYDIAVVKNQLNVIALRGTGFSLRDPADRAWLEEHIRDTKPLLVVLDSVASLSGVDIKDDQATLPIMRWGARVATAYDTTPVWIAHDRKGKPGEASFNDLDDLFGSRVVTSQTDFAFRLLRSGADRVLRCAKMRGATEPQDLTLQVTVVADQVFGMRCSNDVSGPSMDLNIAKAIREYLEAHPGATMSGLRDTVAAQVTTRAAEVGKVATTLLQEGKIINEGTPTRFSLSWATGEACPDMSDVSDVSGHDSVEACPVSYPL